MLYVRYKIFSIYMQNTEVIQRTLCVLDINDLRKV